MRWVYEIFNLGWKFGPKFKLNAGNPVDPGILYQGSAPGRVLSGFCDPARKPGFRAGFWVANFKFRAPGRALVWLRVPGTRTKTRNFLDFLI